MIIKIAGLIPSQNVRDRRHWSQNQKEKESWVFKLLACRSQCPIDLWYAIGFRSIVITSVRPRKITDSANLIGGCKSLVDALVKTGLLIDDADDCCHITYAQQTGSPAMVIIETKDNP